MKALYDLNRSVASFDFFNWMLCVQSKGATEIVFDTRQFRDYKWVRPTVRRRYESILFPGPALAGMSCSVGMVGEVFAPWQIKEFIEFYRDGGRFRKLRSVFQPGDAKYTVTLRRTERSPNRNSNEHSWREFAAEIGARVIEDYEIQPIGLHERMALYAGAEMNFFVTNGPAMMCVLSDYPMMIFACDVMRKSFGKIGIEDGGQFPWSGPHQRLIWEPDELPILLTHFEAWLNARRSELPPERNAR